MTEFNAQKVEDLVSLHGGIINFGNETSAVGDEWIEKAEKIIGLSLPISYKWFLNKYAGGEIGSEEIYSLYGMDFDPVNGGDIVYQHLVGLNNGLVDNQRVVVSETDFGEVFFFDFSSFKEGECPVKIRIPSGETQDYAENFYEFLYKRILAHV